MKNETHLVGSSNLAPGPANPSDPTSFNLTGLATAIVGFSLTVALYLLLWRIEGEKGVPANDPSDIIPALNFFISGFQIFVFLIGATACCTVCFISLMVNLLSWADNSNPLAAVGATISAFTFVPFLITVIRFLY